MRLCPCCFELVDPASDECPYCGNDIRYNTGNHERKRNEFSQLQQQQMANGNHKQLPEQGHRQQGKSRKNDDTTTHRQELQTVKGCARSQSGSVQQQSQNHSESTGSKLQTKPRKNSPSDNFTNPSEPQPFTSLKKALKQDASLNVTRQKEQSGLFQRGQINSGKTAPKPLPKSKPVTQALPQAEQSKAKPLPNLTTETRQKLIQMEKNMSLNLLQGVSRRETHPYDRSSQINTNSSTQIFQSTDLMTKGQIDSHSLVRCPQPKTMMPSAGQRHSVRLNDWQTVTEKLTSPENQGTTLTVLEPYLEAQLSTIEPASKKKALIVAAIDFGTTYSGYAYSFTEEYKKDPTKIHMNIKWHTGDYVSQKTKTSILFNSDGSFNSFGYEAEAKFSELTDDNEHRDYIFFEQFKMKLFKREENRRKFRSDMKLEDGRGHQMEALKVFSESIKFMINHFKTSCRVQHLNLRDNDVHWVLTIPAIWSDEAKQFMRKAAQMAGIPDDLLTLAYEPEAAALCCKEMVVQRSQGLENCNLESFSVGQKFIVLDCGGGTIDITCYEVLEGWSLEELEKPIGGPWGGTVIDNEFMKILKKIIGNDKWQNFIDKNAEDALEIKQTFEAKKKDVTRDVTIAFPSSVRNDLQSSLKGSIYSPNVRSIKDKLRFKKDFIVSLFETTILEIINLLNLLLAKPNIKDINSILMVGGFSECDLLYQRVKHNFPLKNVICPPEAVSAIVKGAVMFGHNPLLIRERKCPRTYGISTNVPFNASIHPIRLKTCNDRGEEKCSDVFNPLVKIGESLTVGKTVRYIECHPSNSYDSEATIEVYASTSDNPMFTIDENVRSVGTLCMPMPDISCSKNRIIVIQMEFGLTEIVVSAFDKETRNGKKTCFKCI